MIIYKGHASFSKAISSAHEFAQSTLGYIQANKTLQSADHITPTFPLLKKGENVLRTNDVSIVSPDPDIISLLYKQHCEITSHHRIVIRKIKNLKKNITLSNNKAAQAKMLTLENLKHLFEGHLLFHAGTIDGLASQVGEYGFFKKLSDKILVNNHKAKIAIRENRGKATACGATLVALKIVILVSLIKKYSKNKKRTQIPPLQNTTDPTLINPGPLMYAGYSPITTAPETTCFFC